MNKFLDRVISVRQEEQMLTLDPSRKLCPICKKHRLSESSFVCSFCLKGKREPQRQALIDEALRLQREKLPMKLAAECSECDCCGEPWCDECQKHYADCDHPGPMEESNEEEG